MREIKTSNQMPFGSSKTDLKVTGFALFVAILLHVLIFIFAPRNFSIMASETKPYEDFEIDFELPEIENVIPEFIEANPAANDNKPINDTPFESFKDQSAAQEKVENQEFSNLPKIKGENEKSHKVVSGNLQEEVLMQNPEAVFETLERPLTNPSTTNQSTQNPETPSPAQNLEENIPEEIIQENADLPPPPPPAPQEPENQEPSPAVEEPLPMPKPRPHLSLQTASGPLKKNNFSANSIGITAVDSRFSEFGAYEQRMTEAIARQWYLLASMQSLSSEVDTQVVIEFFLNTDGEITAIKVLFNSSTITGKTLCEQAILSTAPYGKWTPEMIAVLGSQNQSVKFTFYYK